MVFAGIITVSPIVKYAVLFFSVMAIFAFLLLTTHIEKHFTEIMKPRRRYTIHSLGVALGVVFAIIFAQGGLLANLGIGIELLGGFVVVYTIKYIQGEMI